MRARRGGASLGIRREPTAVRDDRAAVFLVVRKVLRLVGDVADDALGEEQRADRLGVRARVDLALFHRQPEFAGGEDAPLDLAPRIDAVRAENAVGENERRRAHSGNTDPFAAQVGDRVDIALHRRLHAQAALVDAGGKFYVEPLLDRLEEIHHEMVRDVVTAEREHVLVFAPLAFHELDLETFLLEKSQLDRGENRRLAGDSDVADAHFGQPVLRFSRQAIGLFAPRQEQRCRRQAKEKISARKNLAHEVRARARSLVFIKPRKERQRK